MNTSDEPLDEQDLLVLDAVREVYEALDPMPADLLDGIRFSIAVRDLGMEVARESPSLLAVGTRGEDDRRLLSFESASATITIGLRVDDAGAVRLDGWLTPAGTGSVELRSPRGSWTTETDERGRFVLDGLPRTSAYLVIRAGAVVTTPTIEL
ncbi:hypothetical protein [Lentzea sp.]|uniref:hypothetical protein n=1 Tax=Lentzea sp. TaxID=56099 RepID=UPI002BB24354|nr:hypothetical protein [Lentzea sp.]HUQ55880.1 hypothetical protein [Lentzea sp.]